MDAKLLGEFIAQRRKELGFTQASLAEKIHVTDKAVSRWERGIGLPDIGNIEALAQALDISLIELMQARQNNEENISTEEAEQIVIDTIEWTKATPVNKTVRILGTAELCGFTVIIAAWLTLIVLSGNSLAGSIGSMLSGLISWMIPIWYISISQSKKKAHAVFASFSLAAAALMIQFFQIADEVYTGDYSALLDTMNALIFIVVLYIFLTAVLNLVMIRSGKIARKKQRIEELIVLFVFFGIMMVLLLVTGNIIADVIRFDIRL